MDWKGSKYWMVSCMDALINRQIQQISEFRASCYWFFSTLYANELDDDALLSLAQGANRDRLIKLSETPSLALNSRRLQRNLDQLMGLECPTETLKNEYAELFLMENSKGAPPYASVYQSHERRLFQEPHFEMLQRLKDIGLPAIEGCNEPADHLAIQLDYLGNAVIQAIHSHAYESSRLQKSFIQNNLLTWLPEFHQQMRQTHNSDVYQSLTDLLICFLKHDLNSL